MTRRSKGTLAGRSRNLTRHVRHTGMSVNDVIKDFKPGDKVAIMPKSNASDIPHPRYRGKIGTVVARRGSAYEVEIKAMSARRRIIVPSLHINKI